jgi:hypothetical protein
MLGLLATVLGCWKALLLIRITQNGSVGGNRKYRALAPLQAGEGM